MRAKLQLCLRRGLRTFYGWKLRVTTGVRVSVTRVRIQGSGIAGRGVCGTIRTGAVGFPISFFSAFLSSSWGSPFLALPIPESRILILRRPGDAFIPAASASASRRPGLSGTPFHSTPSPSATPVGNCLVGNGQVWIKVPFLRIRYKTHGKGMGRGGPLSDGTHWAGWRLLQSRQNRTGECQ